MAQDLLEQYTRIRRLTRQLCQPLTPEDMQVQSMPSASPAKWHLAHTTWFFETFLLQDIPDYRLFDSRFNYLFNSYYNAIGDRIARPQRGLLSRPTVEQVFQYREYVDAAMVHRGFQNPDKIDRITLGLHHEQQHQELLLTDIKHAFAGNPLRPVYQQRQVRITAVPQPLEWLTHPGGLVDLGHAGEPFAFDNETPRHIVYLQPFRIANRLVNCGDWLAFMEDGGYERAELWLSDGWEACRSQGWKAPLYWEKQQGQWKQFTLQGMQSVAEEEPICHISYFEADAYARWAGARLPTEAEWEIMASTLPCSGTFLEAFTLHPTVSNNPGGWFGEVWQWTASPYVGYPGFRPAAGAIGEYNGKFMNGQYVLRGGSCLTPRSHFRITYRNFFPPDARWQFTGLRLAAHA